MHHSVFIEISQAIHAMMMLFLWVNTSESILCVHPKKIKLSLQLSFPFALGLLSLIHKYVYSRWKKHIMELFNEDFITFKHKGSSLCWRLMT